MGFTGRGAARFENGDYFQGVFYQYTLLEGFRVQQGVTEMVERSVLGKHFLATDRPGLANLTDFDPDEFEWMDIWAQSNGYGEYSRLSDAYDDTYTDDIIPL